MPNKHKIMEIYWLSNVKTDILWMEKMRARAHWESRRHCQYVPVSFRVSYINFNL